MWKTKTVILGEDEWKFIFYQLDFRHLVKCQKVCKLWYKWINDIYREMTRLVIRDEKSCLLYCNINHVNRRFTLTYEDVNIDGNEWDSFKSRMGILNQHEK